MKSNPYDEQKKIAQERIDTCESGLIGITAGLISILVSIIIVSVFQ